MRRARLALAIVLASWAAPAFAWDDHALVTWGALHDVAGFRWPQVAACPIDELLARRVADARGPRLDAVLDEAERTAEALQPALPARPEALRFQVPADFATHPVSLRAPLLAALRVNPTIKLADFIQLLPGETELRDLPPLDTMTATILPDPPKLADPPLHAAPAGHVLDGAAVLTTASDEPDYGHDIGLFSDDKTPQGASYGFGTQPFGNPALSFGTQAPFHIGYYHESSVLYRLAPAFRRTFPELRAAQYTALARWAFAAPDPNDGCSTYWGLRFLGWALHYVEDLTQPYHATIFPGKSTAGMVWINTLDAVGIHGPKARAVTLLSNRHLALENIARHRLAEELAKPKGSSPLIARMADASSDGALPPFDLHDLRGVVSSEAHADANQVDALLAACLPAHDVDDPTYDFGADPHQPDLYAVVQAAVQAGKTPACAQLLEALDTRLARAAVHARRMVHAYLPR